MAGIKLEQFRGMIPRSSDRLLPPMSATEAKNTKLLNGEVRGFRALREQADFTAKGVDPVRRAFRIRDPSGGYQDDWLVYDSRDVDIVRSPLINDLYDRYFIAGDGRPKMTTFERIAESSNPLYLGIPAPLGAPGVTPPAGTDETRAYVYTFESSFGEEGPPSPPTVVSGNAGTWELAGIDTSTNNEANRSITKVNIYRTVSGGNSSNFYFVAQIAFGTAVYSDAQSTSTVAANNIMESTSYIEPPTDLEGIVVMPNGYLVGWVGKRLLFSEPYRPHAWPAEYELATEFPIVGLVVWGTTLVIGTQSQPYFGQGTTPSSFTTRKLDAVEPCLSRRGMVATTAGAYYPSINGLVLADASGARVITQDILTKEEWARYTPSSIFAAQLGLQYIAFTSTSAGFVFNPTEPETKLVELDGFANIEGIETDKYSGNVLLLGQQRAWDWDPENAERLSWRWQSKKYQTPEPLNFGAARLMFKTGDDDISTDIEAYYGVYNTSLLAAIPSGSGEGIDPGTNDVFLCEFDGSHSDTSATDDATAKTITFGGNAALSSAQAFTGATSCFFPGDAGDYLTIADDADWDFGSGDFMIEFAIFPTAYPSNTAVLVGHSDGSSQRSWAVMINNVGKVGLEQSSTGSGAVTNYPLARAKLNQWSTIGVGRFGGTIYVTLNKAVSGDSGAFTFFDSSSAMTIGAYSDGSRRFTGYIDHLRITKGAGRHNGRAIIDPVPYYQTVGPFQRGLNTLNGHVLGGSPAQADALVAGWTEPEIRQPLGGSLFYPLARLSFQTLAVRLQVKTGGEGTIRFDKVIYNEDIFRLPTGYKEDIWQFNMTGNTDVYSLQVGTTPRALKQV